MQPNALTSPAADLDLAVNDLGPLAWVLDELRKSLDSAAKALKRFVRDAEAARGSDLAALDASQLRLARQQLHQAVGALEMVGLAGPALVLRSMEAAVQKFVQHPAQCTHDAAAKIERASFALTEYLEAVLADKPISAVSLFPQYREVQELVRADRIHPADLWPNEWRWIDPNFSSGVAPHGYGDVTRGIFDQSVLQIMKGDTVRAAGVLKELSLGLSGGQTDRQPKIFWLVAAAYFEGLAHNLIGADIYVRRAASRVLLQYLSLSKGSLGISERLAQDLLFFCSQAVAARATDAPVLSAVRAAYGLARFRPVDYEAVQFGRFDPALLAQARKRIVSAKETWSSLSAGDANKFKQVADQFSLVADSLVKLHPPSEPLALALTKAIDMTVRSGRAPAIELAMEVATSVLYLEAAFDDLDPRDAQLAERTRHLAERLENVRAGGEPQPLESWMEELYRRVSDKQTMGSVVGELRISLGELEKSLDLFFRNPQDKTVLRDVPGQLSQMRGVLSVLGLEQASQAVLRMRDSVQEMLVTEVDEQRARAAGTFDALGNNLGALSFLIDMLNYQPALAKKLFVYDDIKGELKPLMGRANRQEEAAASVTVQGAALSEQLVSVMQDAGSGVPQDNLTVKLDTLATQAALAGQPALAQTARDASSAVARHDRDATAIALTGLAAALPAPIAAPVASPPSADDADPFEEDDLRDIFLEEAREVAANGQEALRILAAQPGDIGQLTTLRRVFHTLKGSSRMVGLNEFGEAGWSLEQMLNGWLAEQKPASDEIRQVATEALAGFALWIEDIAAGQDSDWLASSFRTSADAMRTQGRVVPLVMPARHMPSTESAESSAQGVGSVGAVVVSDVPAGLDPIPVNAAASASNVSAAPTDLQLLDARGDGTQTIDHAAIPAAVPPVIEAETAPLELANAGTRLPEQLDANDLVELDDQREPVQVAVEAAENFDLLFDFAEPIARDEPARHGLSHDFAAPEIQGIDLESLAAIRAGEPRSEPNFAALVEQREQPLAHEPHSAGEMTEAFFVQTPADSGIETTRRVELLEQADAVPETTGQSEFAPRQVKEIPQASDASDAVFEQYFADEQTVRVEATDANEPADTAFEIDFFDLSEPVSGDSIVRPIEANAPDLDAPGLTASGAFESTANAAVVAAVSAPASTGHDAAAFGSVQDVPADEEQGDLVASSAAALDADGARDIEQAPLDEMPFVAAQAPIVEVVAQQQPERSELDTVAIAEAEANAKTDASAEADAPAEADGLRSGYEGVNAESNLEGSFFDNVAEEQVKFIGDLRIGIPLYNVYLNEADEWSRRLVTDLSEWSIERHHPIDDSTVALAHSLAGSSATVGFEALSDIARALEHALQMSQTYRNSATEQHAAIFVQAAEDIRRLLHQFAAGFLKTPDELLLQRLKDIEFVEQPPQLRADEDEFGFVDSLDQPAFADSADLTGSRKAAVPDYLAAAFTVNEQVDSASLPVPGLPDEPEAGWAAAKVQDFGAPEDAPAALLAKAPSSSELGWATAQPPSQEALPSVKTFHDASADAFIEEDDEIDAVDAIDAELFPFFEEEADELIPLLGNAMRQWVAKPGNQGPRMEVLRALHTLKGSARLAGALRLGEMAHRIETEIEFLGSESVSAQDFEPLLNRFDALANTYEVLRGGEVAPATRSALTVMKPASPISPASSLGASTATPVEDSSAVPAFNQDERSFTDPASAKPLDDASKAAPVSTDEAVAGEPTYAPTAEIFAGTLDSDIEAELRPALEPEATGERSASGAIGAIPAGRKVMIPAPKAMSMQPLRQAASASIRVRSQLLDRMVNQAGEVMITRSRLEVELSQLRSSLGDMNDNLNRLRQQLRDIELQAETQMQSRLAQAKELQAGFDPLEFDRFTRVQELTRMMAESVNDVATVQRTLQRTVEATEDDLIAQARQTRELQRDLLRTRMVEFEGISDRLYRVVRLASKETGKQVKLDLLGSTIEMDRGMLDRMTPAFEHLLRNCVAHGIETPEVRSRAGKDPVGLITVHLRQEGNDVSVDFSDDGAGLDLGRIREKAVSLGMVPADQPLSDAEAANLIFLPGFSTASQVTELSGRGIGMDVVRSEVNSVGGRIETSTVVGGGTHFKLVLPLTTAVTQVVMIRTGSLAVGVPANVVETVRRSTAKELQQAYNTGFLDVGGDLVPFFWSGALLQTSHHSSEVQGKTTPVVIFRSAAQRIALHVDEVVGNQEVVVKNLGPQLSRLPGLAGMSVLASGAVVLIYNPVALASIYGEQARSWSRDSAEPHVLEAATGTPGDVVKAPVAVASTPQIPLIMVVDDSITVRRVTQRLLQREGYRVVMAADGLQALERLQDERPAVVLSDIEMPRMDGFDLARNIRADARLSGLPIVMITSRIAEKHREHAKELGVDHYLGKPYSEDELMSLVRHYCNAELAPA